MKELKINYGITDRSNESVNKYLCEVNRKDMISTDEEVALAQRIHRGDEEAVVKLVEANLRFVVSVAKQYQNRGIPLADIIEEGNIGLIRAAKMFDETRGFKFISYAVWWIRQSIHQALTNNGNMIRLPINKTNIMNRIFSFMAEFVQKNEREPSVAEICEALEIEDEQVRIILGYDGRGVSINTPLGDAEGGTLEETIKSESDDADRNLDKESLTGDILLILDKLPPREKKIEMMFFGIGCPPCSTADIANELHITRERVRQVHERNIRRLRNNKQVASLLLKYLGE